MPEHHVTKLHAPESPVLAFGVASVVLGSIAVILFWLPILGVFIGVCGFCAGFAEIVWRRTARPVNFRWAIAGCGLCAIAIGGELVIAYTPITRPRPTTPNVATVENTFRPFVPPPARP